MMVTKLIILILPLFLWPTFATETEANIFSKAYNNDYQALMCSHNMLTLSERFIESSFSLKDTYIVHVRALNAPWAEVRAYRARGINTVQRWSFHAFMIRNGRVFDMDFKENRSGLELSSYLEKMFFPNSHKRQKLLYQIKPAHLYNGEDFDGSMNSAKYPLRDLNHEGIIKIDYPL